MLGLDPSTHVAPFSPAGVDGRIKSGQDDEAGGCIGPQA